MLAQQHKFPPRTDFTRFRSHSARLVTPHTTIYHLKSSLPSRLSVVIPKKVSKLATSRNALKRLTYDTVWPLIQTNQLDCVIVYKPLPLNKSLATTKELVNELSQAVNSL